jgi:hypothetical protein
MHLHAPEYCALNADNPKPLTSCTELLTFALSIDETEYKLTGSVITIYIHSGGALLESLPENMLASPGLCHRSGG